MENLNFPRNENVNLDFHKRESLMRYFRLEIAFWCNEKKDKYNGKLLGDHYAKKDDR